MFFLIYDHHRQHLVPRRAFKAGSRDESGEDPSNSVLGRRRNLTKNVSSLHTPQRFYMPGIDSLDTIDPILLADHPEDVELSLPSSLPSASRDAQCANGLPQLEYRLRLAQAESALHDIRCFRRVAQIIAAKSQTHITNTQKTTRGHSVFDGNKAKITQAVSTYRVARKAITNLAPNEEFGPWKKTLLELKDCDVRGPGYQGTGASRFVESWIWTTATKTSTSADDPDLNAVLRVEWCKAQERAKRYEEEVELVVEEMRRTLVSLEADALEWERRAASSISLPAVEAATAIGIASYAYKQAEVRHKLARTFIDDWYGILEEQPLTKPWLSGYPRPPKDKSQRQRLACNVQLYHSASPALRADPPDAGRTHPSCVNVVFLDADTD